ncbi:MAG TPA: DUF899 domain-containing protein [Capillimicrobium sp.]
MTEHRTATRAEWRAERLALLEREKELTRLSDEVARQRQALPWVPLEKEYVLETENGPRPLAALFEGRSQLLVQHLMLGPGWGAACKSCSSIADGIDKVHEHLRGHDVAFWAVSRAPLGEILAYRERMGWGFPWASAHDSDFNFDFGASSTPERPLPRYNFEPLPEAMTASEPVELPVLSAFALVDGVVHHTYSAQSRGLDAIWGAYAYLDRAPLGRNERIDEHGPHWLRRRDEYAMMPA